MVFAVGLSLEQDNAIFQNRDPYILSLGDCAGPTTGFSGLQPNRRVGPEPAFAMAMQGISHLPQKAHNPIIMTVAQMGRVIQKKHAFLTPHAFVERHSTRGNEGMFVTLPGPYP